ncbi:uncharacterized protein COLE_04809 [Cutaneotrichosporon oleaginosum]|uniref:uncharacterized protein n=1 Tax=Cutaneotrichosporon oleaginosum TaxID=879819 RepID=UPI00132B1873|nr:hypothetical protein COLE_04809 [Cutaneotrichosporon oleaginosum]
MSSYIVDTEAVLVVPQERDGGRRTPDRAEKAPARPVTSIPRRWTYIYLPILSQPPSTSSALHGRAVPGRRRPFRASFVSALTPGRLHHVAAVRPGVDASAVLRCVLPLPSSHRRVPPHARHPEPRIRGLQHAVVRPSRAAGLLIQGAPDLRHDLCEGRRGGTRARRAPCHDLVRYVPSAPSNAGANDSVLPDAEQAVAQHVPLDEYEANLRFFLEGLTSPASPYAVAHARGLNIVLVTPPPLCVPLMGGGAFAREREPATTKAYADVVLRLGEEYAGKAGENWRIGTVDMWGATLKAAGGEGEELAKYLSDGLHLTSEGYAVFWDEYTKLVKTVFKGRGLDWESLDDLPLRMPPWDTVDAARPDILAGMRLPPIRTQI